MGTKHVRQFHFPDEMDSATGIKRIHGLNYAIFHQGAMAYGEYSEYMKSHGCACCTLTTILGAYVPHLYGITPDKTITEIEKHVLGEETWEANYSKPLKNQMPISFMGIRKIMDHYGIAHRFVPMRVREKAHEDIAAHLETGRPVVIETSKIRYRGNLPAAVNDKKFAGSYHTMLIVGIEKDRDTVWVTDSATRPWAGKMQRLKRVSLEELITYMFPCVKPHNKHMYFHGRLNSGGYILIKQYPDNDELDHAYEDRKTRG
ncbi:MAG: C39 family peptidase [Eubacterium sp.]|nr:C39 family peptidase [Candidatus Colimonas fimequi]